MTNENIINPTSQDDDFNLDQSLRPSSFNEFIGQNEVIENLKLYIDASQKRSESFYGQTSHPEALWSDGVHHRVGTAHYVPVASPRRNRESGDMISHLKGIETPGIMCGFSPFAGDGRYNIEEFLEANELEFKGTGFDEEADDLDAMLEGFETSNNIFEDNLEHIKNKRLAKLKLDVAENALKRERMKAIQGAPLKQIAEDDIGRILQNAERAICLIVEDGIIFEDRGERELQNLTQNEFVAKCIYDRMKAMAPHVPYTQFIYLLAPSASFVSSFKLNSLPTIICLDYWFTIVVT